MQIPVIKFSAGNNFKTTVTLSTSDSQYLIEELGMEIGGQVVLEDELGIRYVAKISKKEFPVAIDIMSLLDDAQSSGRNDLRGVLGQIRKSREKK